jgi:hypothetical protein
MQPEARPESRRRLELAFLLVAFIATGGYLVARHVVADAPAPGVDGNTSALYGIVSRSGGHGS